MIEVLFPFTFIHTCNLRIGVVIYRRKTGISNSGFLDLYHLKITVIK